MKCTNLCAPQATPIQQTMQKKEIRVTFQISQIAQKTVQKVIIKHIKNTAKKGIHSRMTGETISVADVTSRLSESITRSRGIRLCMGVFPVARQILFFWFYQ